MTTIDHTFQLTPFIPGSLVTLFRQNNQDSTIQAGTRGMLLQQPLHGHSLQPNIHLQSTYLLCPKHLPQRVALLGS